MLYVIRFSIKSLPRLGELSTIMETNYQLTFIARTCRWRVTVKL